jgi:hypothetical protein
LFAVGTLNESRSPSGNTSIKTAAALGDDSVVNGVSVTRQSSWFQVGAKKGQRLLLRVSAKALDSRMSPVMLLRSGAGERLARANADGLIDFTAPANGNYLIQVHATLAMKLLNTTLPLPLKNLICQKFLLFFLMLVRIDQNFTALILLLSLLMIFL